jgi:hypothetical protein
MPVLSIPPRKGANLALFWMLKRLRPPTVVTNIVNTKPFERLEPV